MENMKNFVKIIVYVPVSHASALRKALGEAGAGKMGNYDHCSFSSRGMGRFRPNERAHPFIGKCGRMEEVEEEKIEMICERAKVKEVLAALRKNHPYEEPAFEISPLIDETEF
jgi:hypothetical protein